MPTTFVDKVENFNSLENSLTFRPGTVCFGLSHRVRVKPRKVVGNHWLSEKHQSKLLITIDVTVGNPRSRRTGKGVDLLDVVRRRKLRKVGDQR